MTQRSGIQTTLSAAAKLKRLEKSSLATVESVVHTAANATCLGKQQTLQELQPIADAR